ncbi:Nitrate reductase [bioreactor metagenome]|uniref:Nitrate reductase n=1 Tax=bioreactor metagenome TaxID=1076179 RepID=A0A644WEU0_9ZZZZ
MDTINVILNGKNVQAFPGESILDLAARNGYHIPTLCHDPRLEPFSSCFVCVVHVEKMRGLQPSCSTKVTEGMVIDTEREDVKKSRKMALELLLSNHYANCIGPCKETCPANVDVQGYISLIEKGLYSEAVGLIKERNPLPAICGRVCVRPCELACRRNLLDENNGVGIDYLKRFAADKDLASENHYRPEVAPSTGKKVAIIGGGPGGLSAAYWLAQKGHKADIFEAMPHAGGWLRYGIPEYRLPNDLIDKEVSTITELGVNIFTGKKLGENISFKEIRENYDATILTIGSQKGALVGVDGEDADGVFSGIDFLRNMEATGQRYNFKGKKIVVVGGGNTAMDCCRASRRCGSENVTVIYRRTEAEMPANPIEIHESKLEGVDYMFLTAPVKILKDAEGKLKAIVCQKMELGEPDASGRRRPVPVEGSDFEVECDYILAAIGQKTEVNFINDINEFSPNGQLKLTKWGDIDASKETLETSIPGVFAAGDGVTGPATAIAAIAQAKIAVHSCDLYLNGQAIVPPSKEFFSRKENFRKQEKPEYENKFKHQLREEMPVLEPDARMNFNEVELGYSSEEVAKHETSRCLECGCGALNTCDLKKHATEYNAVQQHYSGSFREYNVDFSHPYIEIDQNKCILCGRCIRICKEVVGAAALGFVNRGFDTYVAPSMGMSLTDTKCESCGMCVSTCPTGAMSENKLFKPGPVKTESFKTICNYCSMGCELEVQHRGGFVYGIKGSKGQVNQGGNICNSGRFGYQYMNDGSRILSPRVKENGTWKNISWDEAFDLISRRIKSVKPSENAFTAGARLSNEEQYLIQKIARAGAKTNNISSFHYMERGKGYTENSQDNVPFVDLKKAKAIWVLSPELIKANGVAGFAIQNARKVGEIPVTVFSTDDNGMMNHKADRVIHLKSKYAFVKAMNYYYLSSGLYNAMFIKGRTEGFDNYKMALLKENYDALVAASGLSKTELEKLADEFNNVAESVIVYTESGASANCAMEITNLMLITGKLGKTASGVVSLKAKNNSQGLRDTGVCPKTAPGGRRIVDAKADLEQKWGVSGLSDETDFSIKQRMMDGEIKNLFIFGEDPAGTALNAAEVNSMLSKPEFMVVADYFMTPTAEAASLVLPMAFPFETGGTFTNTQRVIQRFGAEMKPKTGKCNIELLNGIASTLGLKTYSGSDEVFVEFATLLPAASEPVFTFTHTDSDNPKIMFAFGADHVVLRHQKQVAELLNK